MSLQEVLVHISLLQDKNWIPQNNIIKSGYLTKPKLLLERNTEARLNVHESPSRILLKTTITLLSQQSINKHKTSRH